MVYEWDIYAKFQAVSLFCRRGGNTGCRGIWLVDYCLHTHSVCIHSLIYLFCINAAAGDLFVRRNLICGARASRWRSIKIINNWLKSGRICLCSGLSENCRRAEHTQSQPASTYLFFIGDFCFPVWRRRRGDHGTTALLSGALCV